MTVYYVGTSYANLAYTSHVRPSIATLPIPTFINTTSQFDPNYVRTCVQGRSGEYAPIIDLGTSLTDFWLHFDLRSSTDNTTNNLAAITFFDDDGLIMHGILGTGTSAQHTLEYSTTGTTFTEYAGSAFGWSSSSAVVTVDIHLKIHGTTGVFEVYSNGSLIASVTGNTLANGDNSVRYIRLESPQATRNNHYSAIIVADESTINWRVQELEPLTGTQDFSDWTGAFSVFDDAAWLQTKTDSAYADTNGDTSTYVADNTHASLASLVPVCVGFSARCYATPDSPVQNIQFGLSIASTFYASPTKTVGFELGEIPITHIWNANPSNSSGWTHSDIDNLQAGFRAIT